MNRSVLILCIVVVYGIAVSAAIMAGNTKSNASTVVNMMMLQGYDDAAIEQIMSLPHQPPLDWESVWPVPKAEWTQLSEDRRVFVMFYFNEKRELTRRIIYDVRGKK